jgi:PAS domain S-box-containing protein
MRIAVSIILSVLFALPVFSQSFHFNRQVKGVELPSENVSGIIQDESGLMWFNTAMGVFYSDGFNTYPIPNRIQSELGTKVSLFKDEDGILWLFNQMGKPRIFKKEKSNWEKLNVPDVFQSDSPLSQMSFAVVGSGRDKTFIILSKNELAIRKENNFSWVIRTFDKNSSGSFRSAFNNDGIIYLFFEKASYQLAENRLMPFYFNGIQLPTAVAKVQYDSVSKQYFFLGASFLASGANFNTVEKINSRNLDDSGYPSADYFDLQVKNGLVYYFFNSQLFRYSTRLGTSLKIDAYVPVKSNKIYASFVDREGIIWIGTHRGLVNINSLRFSNFQMNPLLDDEVSALHRLDNGSYLLGFNNGLQHLKEGKWETLQEFPGYFGKPLTRITNFAQDKNGIVWFSSNAAGLGRLDPKSGVLEYSKISSDTRVNHVSVLGDSLMISDGDKIYLSNIYNRKENHFKKEISTDILREINQKSILIRKIGRLKSGKTLLLQVGFNLIQNEDSETDRYVSVFGYDYLEKNDTLILGTERGLRYYKNGKLNDYYIHGKKINRPVYALLLDSKDNLWIGTDLGVFLANGNSLRNFGEQSGLIGSEINRGALIEADEGNIFIGTQRGLSIYYPTRDEKTGLLPTPKILEVRVINQNEGQFNPAKIPYGNNLIQLTFQAVSFMQNVDLNIRYKLEGYEEEWTEIINPRTNQLVFSNLPPGNYRLLLQAGLQGEYNPKIAVSNKFTILKPVYLQWWFIIMTLLMFLGFGFIFNVLLQQWKKQRAMKRTIDEKTKQALFTEDQFRNVWNSSRDGLLLSLPDGKIIAVNPGFTHLVGISETELVNQHINVIFSDPEYFDVQQELKSRLAQSKGITNSTLELTMPLKSGSKEVEIYTAELKSEYEGSPIYLSVYRDITQKKEYEKGLKLAKEKAEEASKIKSNFLSNMSHEIRTPLNGILGSTENIIMQRQHDLELIAQLDIIIESGERLLHTINSILDLSKIEANKMDIVLQETNINEFLSKLLLPLKTLAIKKGLLLSARFESPALTGWIERRYFEMIVNNLVGNAIKYSEKGLIVVQIKQVDEQVHLEVVDQGIGMSEDFLSKIFSPFEQESGGYGRNYEGSGLGLAITKNLIEKLSGSIYFSSIKNVGTTVTVLLPLNQKP